MTSGRRSRARFSGTHHQAAARRDHAGLVVLEQLLEGVGLEVAEAALAVLLEDLGDRAVGDLLERRVGVDEVAVESARPGVGPRWSCRTP